MIIKKPKTIDELFDYAITTDHGKIHIKNDNKTGLKAIISVHNTYRGPALGGCRFINYNSNSDAIYDALRLARGMTYKAAISNLALGGGKGVIIKPEKDFDRKALLESFGEFVQELGGTYITAVDSGTSVSDMDIIAQKTDFVTCSTNKGGDPAVATAFGVFKGIMAAVNFRLKRQDLEGLDILIQGAGNVGSLIAHHLKKLGANIIIADINVKAAEKLTATIGAKIIDSEKVFDTKCDIFVPCALGGILNPDSISKLQASIVAGAANNQLANISDAEILYKKNITYVPDYVINAGGLIEASSYYDGKYNKQIVDLEISKIYDTVDLILNESKNSQKNSATVADEIAEKRFKIKK